MSQRVIGLDIGAHSIKATALETSFRNVQILYTLERKIPQLAQSEVGSPWGTTLDVLNDLKNEGKLEADTIICALPGDKSISRFLEFPFSDKKQIESAVGFEFEGHVPFSIDDLVYDYQVVEEIGEGGSRVLVTAAKLEEFEELLEGLRNLELDPKNIGIGPLSYVNLIELLEEEEETSAVVVLVDLGAERTDILISQGGKVLLSRTLKFGGNTITECIGDALGLSRAESEGLKCEDGLVVAEGVQLLDPQEMRLAPAIRSGLSPVVTGLMQSFERVDIQLGETVDKVLLCGGGSRLRGMADYLQTLLKVPVEHVSVGTQAINKMADPYQGEHILCKSLALALKATTKSSSGKMNLRRGQYAYAGDFQFLRDKMVALVLLGVLLFVAGLGRGYMRYTVLVEERDAQVVALVELSKEVLGKEKDDFDTVLSLLKKRPEGASVKLFPAITAKEVFFDVTTIMQNVNDTSHAEILAMRGAEEVPEEVKEEQPAVDPPGAGTAPVRGPDGNLIPKLVTPPATRPPGPAQATPPAITPRTERLNKLRSAREARLSRGIVNPSVAIPPSVGRPFTPPVVNPTISAGSAAGMARPVPARSPGPQPASMNPPASQEEGAVADPTEEGKEEQPDETFRVELESIEISEKGANLKGEANSIEAATLLEQMLGKHRCFSNVVLEGTDKITFERHRDWRSFRIEMDIDCEVKEESKSKIREEE